MPLPKTTTTDSLQRDGIEAWGGGHLGHLEGQHKKLDLLKGRGCLAQAGQPNVSSEGAKRPDRRAP
jgi:hypothetical protein